MTLKGNVKRKRIVLSVEDEMKLCDAMTDSKLFLRYALKLTINQK